MPVQLPIPSGPVSLFLVGSQPLNSPAMPTAVGAAPWKVKVRGAGALRNDAAVAGGGQVAVVAAARPDAGQVAGAPVGAEVVGAASGDHEKERETPTRHAAPLINATPLEA